MAVFLDVTSRSLVHINRHFGSPCCLCHHGGDYIVQHRRIQPPSCSSPWEPKISLLFLFTHKNKTKTKLKLLQPG
jgi:hypothetical protein